MDLLSVVRRSWIPFHLSQQRLLPDQGLLSPIPRTKKHLQTYLDPSKPPKSPHHPTNRPVMHLVSGKKRINSKKPKKGTSISLTRFLFTHRRWQVACGCVSCTLHRRPRSSQAALPWAHYCGSKTAQSKKRRCIRFQHFWCFSVAIKICLYVNIHIMRTNKQKTNTNKMYVCRTS